MHIFVNFVVVLELNLGWLACLRMLEQVKDTCGSVWVELTSSKDFFEVGVAGKSRLEG